MNKADRYAQAAERELDLGSVRQPAWEAAMTEAAGEREMARALYQRIRVQQNLEIELEHQLALSDLQRQQQFNDSVGIGFWTKTGVLGAALFLTIGLWLLLK